ncbi:hypothetical protein [Paenibacillus sp.]|nr:hypothetical protein [Paenibacillus sp.]HZG84944.1 hypothetical protein [Paenibacillus sp.]
MPKTEEYDETLTELQREVQEALRGLPGIGSPGEDAEASDHLDTLV